MDINWDAIFNVVEKATPAATKIINTLKKKPKAEREYTAQAIMSGVNVPTPQASGGLSVTTLALIGGGVAVAFLLWRR